MKGEIRGFPKQQLIRDFNNELVGPFVEIARDDAFDKKLVLWLDQIGNGVANEVCQSKIEQIVFDAKVVEARRSADGMIVVEYLFRARAFKILAKFSGEGVLSAYTLVPSGERIDDVSATFFTDYERDTTIADEIVEFCMGIRDNEGCHIGLGRNSLFSLGVWAFGEIGREWFDISCMFGSDEELWLEWHAESREDMLAVVKSYLNGGLGAAQSGREWFAHFADDCFDGQGHRIGCVDLCHSLRGDLCHAKLLGQAAVADSIEVVSSRFKDWDRHSLYANWTFGDESKYASYVKAIANRGREGFEGYEGVADDLVIDTYLAIRGDKPSMRRLARSIGRADLANYWHRKVDGLSASTDPLPDGTNKTLNGSADSRQLVLGL